MPIPEPEAKNLRELGYHEQQPCGTCFLGIVENIILQIDGTTKKVKDVCPCCNGKYWDCKNCADEERELLEDEKARRA